MNKSRKNIFLNPPKNSSKSTTKKDKKNPKEKVFNILDGLFEKSLKINEYYHSLPFKEKISFLLGCLSNESVSLKSTDYKFYDELENEFILNSLSDHLRTLPFDKVEDLEFFLNENPNIAINKKISLFQSLNECIEEIVFKEYGSEDFDLSTKIKKHLLNKFRSLKNFNDEKIIKDNLKTSFYELVALFNKYFPHLDLQDYLNEEVVEEHQQELFNKMEILEQQNLEEIEEKLELVSLVNHSKIKEKRLVQEILNNKKYHLLKEMIEKGYGYVYFDFLINDESSDFEENEVPLDSCEDENFKEQLKKSEIVYEEENLNEKINQFFVSKGNKTIN